MKKYLTVIAACLLAGGCVSLGLRSGISDKSVKKIKSIAVFSMLGPDLNQTFVGPTSFSNRTENADVSSWGLDIFAENATITDLKRNSQFQKVGLIKGATLATHFGEDDLMRLLKEAQSEGYDTVLIIKPSHYDNAPNVKAGYGVLKVTNLFGRTSVDCYILGIMQVYDVKSGFNLGWQWMFDALSGHPSMTCNEKVEWRDHFTDYTSEQQSKIQWLIKDHFSEVADYTLNSLNLISPKK